METVSIYEEMTARRKVKQSQKAWKYIHDLCSLELSDLNKIAIIDGNQEYTYGSMFREWEHYAAVFSALGMTELEHARVGILGSTSAEVVFSFYGLNMVGAEVSLIASYSAFNPSRIKETILQEKLTDFIMTDDMAQQELLRELLIKRKELGLRHIILLHVPVNGPASIPIMTVAHETKYASMKTLYQPICMETLLAVYGNYPVHYSQQDNDDAAFILHTTGTTSGSGKPVPLSDNALNAAVSRFLKLKDLALPYDNLVTAMIVDLSNSYGMIDQVHLPFAMSATVVAVPGGVLNPLFFKSISAYRISFLFSINSIFERWIKMPEGTEFDFSSLKFVALGGTSVSSMEKKRYNEFIEAHGGKDVTILNGYGLSELGGACCLSSSDLDDESIGCPMPGITIKLYDEETESFFSPHGKSSEGVLYMNAQSMITPQLDGKDIAKIEVIDRKPFVCTNDLVRVDEDGRITYLGRANRFFMRQEGRKYESGKVETEISRLHDIEACAIVPVFVKKEHDNIPMLCVKTLDGAGEPQNVVLDALRQVFITEKILPEEDLPCRVKLAETFPLNANGKLDLFQLNRGQISGEEYDVEEVRESEQLTDFKLTLCQEGPADMIEQVFDDIKTDIKEDIKGKLPTTKLFKQFKKENPTMENNNNLFGNFNAWNQMHQQMMSNMQSMMGQRFPAPNQYASIFQMPEIQSMKEMMPNMETMMPQMQQMAQTMQGMMPNIPAMLNSIALAVLPVFHQQAEQRFSNMNQMNQMAFDMAQRFCEQKSELDAKWYELAMKMLNGEAVQEEAAEAEEEAKEEAKEEAQEEAKEEAKEPETKTKAKSKKD
ncbi:MAG: acyl--CoA ligase [Parasporobacterium sp.]|nr:acyl--CoA ligase [Parasporobacterium sp.]